jgi:23S rRNA pseudouridine2605 synthase
VSRPIDFCVLAFAGLTKKDLPRGRWRELTEKEVGFLKMI